MRLGLGIDLSRLTAKGTDIVEAWILVAGVADEDISYVWDDGSSWIDGSIWKD